MKKLFFVLIIALFILTGCNQNETNVPTIPKDTSNDYQTETPTSTPDTTKNPSETPVDTTKSLEDYFALDKHGEGYYDLYAYLMDYGFVPHVGTGVVFWCENSFGVAYINVSYSENVQFMPTGNEGEYFSMTIGYGPWNEREDENDKVKLRYSESDSTLDCSPRYFEWLDIAIPWLATADDPTADPFEGCVRTVYFINNVELGPNNEWNVGYDAKTSAMEKKE